MTFATYQAAIARIANEELNGEDIEDSICALADAADVSSSDIRAAVTEQQNLVAA